MYVQITCESKLKILFCLIICFVYQKIITNIILDITYIYDSDDFTNKIKYKILHNTFRLLFSVSFNCFLPAFKYSRFPI